MLEGSFWNWCRFQMEYSSKGRLKDKVRGKRPPLPDLPEWIC